MSKLIKQILKEDSEAIKFRYSSGSATDASAPAIKVYTLGGRLIFELTKIPNEIQLNLADDSKGGDFDFRFSLMSSLSDEFKTLEKTDPDLAKKLREEMIDDIVNLSTDGNTPTKKLEEEYSEIFDHLKQMLRASIIEYHHDQQEFFQHAKDEIRAKYLAKIKNGS
jgi:hypothetical protein